MSSAPPPSQQSLPLPLDLVPDAAKRFADPASPAPMRAMAARGLVPVKGADLVFLLVQLSADKAKDVADGALASLKKLPENILLPACEMPLHPAILDGVADAFRDNDTVLERIVANHATGDWTIERVARSASDTVAERIAANEQRLLSAPLIIEALYKNRHTRMSTADRLIELAARNGLELTGIPSFKAHVAAISGQLIAEASDEALPSDLAFSGALAEDQDDPAAIEQDPVDGTEAVKEQFKPLASQIAEMNIAEKVRLATIGNAAARAILVRDPNRMVALAAVSSPMVQEAEAIAMARSKEVGDDVLRYIGNKRDWLRNYELKRALVFNPRTPVGISLRFLSHMRQSDLKILARSKNVAASIKTAALQQSLKRGSD